MGQIIGGEGENDMEAAKKPLLRGWFHAGAAAAALLLTLALAWSSRENWLKLVAMLIFGLSMVEMYTVSAVYHIGRWRAATHRVLRSLDHANIFLLIAGTYTPLCLVLLSGWVRPVLLLIIWALAAVGVGLSMPAKEFPRSLRAALYVIMGWVAILALPAFLEALPAGAVGLLVLGGLLYTVGAVIYALRRPNPFPRIFGFHEIFHLFVIGGSAACAAVIVVWVLPAPIA